MSRIKEIRNRLESIYSGSWVTDGTVDEKECAALVHVVGEDKRIGYSSWEGMIACYSGEDERSSADPVAIANANFVANAPADIAYLLEVIEQYKKKTKKVT